MDLQYLIYWKQTSVCMELKEGVQSVDQGNIPLGLNVWFDGYFTASENNP